MLVENIESNLAGISEAHYNSMEIQHANPSEQHEQTYHPCEIRITTHGKMNVWVDFALKFFEEHEDRPLILHTLPYKTDQASQAVASSADANKSSTTGRDRMHPSTNLIPRLISVVEIIKREYTKKLGPELADHGRLSGLHQYNELGTLEDLDGEQEKEQAEEDRLKHITHALQGRKHIKLKRTAYMKITLCRKQLLVQEYVSVQQPTVRKLSKSARSRAKKRLGKEKHVE